MVQNLTEYLPCILTEDETIEAAQALAKENCDLVDTQARKKDVVADLTAQVKKHELKIGILSKMIASGKEYRDVPVRWEMNYAAGRKRMIRTDTNEIVRETDLTPADKQQALEV